MKYGKIINPIQYKKDINNKNMHLEKLVNTTTGKYIASILIGLGIATLLKKQCKDCITYIAPPLEEIINNLFKFNSKCFKFTSEAVTCDKNPNTLTVNFA